MNTVERRVILGLKIAVGVLLAMLYVIAVLAERRGW